MTAFYAPIVMLPGGWARQVRIEVNHLGMISDVQPGREAQGCTLLDGVVIPAMVNLHSRTFLSAIAGLDEVRSDIPAVSRPWRELLQRCLTPEQAGAIACRAYIDMLKGGYTQVAEFHYLHHDPQGKPWTQGEQMLQQLIVAADQVGIGQTLLPVLVSHNGFGARPADKAQRRLVQDVDRYLRLQQALAGALVRYPLINQGIGFYSLSAVTQEQMEDVLEACDYRLPVYLPVAVSAREVEACLAWSGEKPAEWLFNRFAVDERWCLVSPAYLDAQERALLAESRAVAGMCPLAQASEGAGRFPVSDYIHQGGAWGIGSDGYLTPGAAEELRMLELTQRLRDGQPQRMALPEWPQVGEVLWRQAAAGGARAAGVMLGGIAPGLRADWLVLEQDAWLSHVDDYGLLNRWIFGRGSRQIRDVWVAGREVIARRRHALDASCDAAFARAMQELNAWPEPFRS
ncbi:formimidoylglutamate deiminase [Entomohabitans teleogrylli]|uniref:formimidoylglutamate deiminase n=1 Tax=Entomohabitans teleogrylli TaxID=1384589 RepID=UPI00073D8065|nr:formimidoylglutamate deiminase [Entomohabitans teleogrylli]